jgi:AraC-like DNA-binding protein
MITHRFETTPLLRHEVKFFWTMEQSQDEYNRYPIGPDSFVELILNCGAPLGIELENGARVEMPRAMVNGLQMKPLRLYATGDAQFVAVRLYAWAVRSFINLPATCNLPIVPLDARWQNFAQTFAAVVRHNGYQEAIDCLQQFILDQRRPHPDALPIYSAGESLYSVDGQLEISELVARSYLSPRQFERRFKYFTGVTPKIYARLIRFDAVRTSLFNNPYHSIAALAQDFGFTDQAHLIHEFKAFTTRTPGEFATLLQRAAG